MSQHSKQPELSDPKPKEVKYGFWKIVLIVVSGHLGVRPSAKRKVDFEHANGLHVFAVAVIYFLLIISGLIWLVNRIVVSAT